MTSERPDDDPASQATRAGFLESVDLPELGGVGLTAKLDTGAEWSVADTSAARQVTRGDQTFVVFSLVLERSGRGGAKVSVVETEAPLLRWRRVRSSNGLEEERPVVGTRLRLGDAEFPIELTLADRRAMRTRLLLGREALAGRFVVDPGASFVASERPES